MWCGVVWCGMVRIVTICEDVIIIFMLLFFIKGELLQKRTYKSLLYAASYTDQTVSLSTLFFEALYGRNKLY